MNSIGSYKWQDNQLLGEGGFGKVFKGIDTVNNEECAVKVMNYSSIMDDPLMTWLFKNESQILTTLKNYPYIVCCKEIIQKKPNIYVIMEMQNGGDLRKEILRRKGTPFEENKAKQIINDILKGMKVLVEKLVVHRDLKPENVFISNGKYKVADFGFCQTYTPGQILDLCCGTPGYMSPQIVLEEKYTEKCDIWSIGVIYYELLFNNFPGKGDSDEERINDLKQKGLNFPHNSRISIESQDFLKGCLQYDEDKRWNWIQVFQSEIFTQEKNKTLQPDNTENQQILTEAQQLEEIRNIKTVQLSLVDKVFMQQLQKWVQNMGPDGVDIVMTKYFPRGSINLKEFEVFCSQSITKNVNIQNIFKYLDFIRDGEVTKQEFSFRIYQTNYDDDEKKNQVLHKLMTKRVLKQIKLELKKKNLDPIQVFNQETNFDKNGMDITQFGQYLQKIDNDLTDYEIQIIFDFFDSNSNNHISLEEFLQALNENDRKIQYKKLLEKQLNDKQNKEKRSICSCFQVKKKKKSDKYKENK